MKSARLFLSFIIGCVALVVSCRRVPPPPTGEDTDAVTKTKSQEWSIVERPTLPPRAVPKDDLKNSGCTRRGPLPDPQCTPGKANPGVKATHICTPGFDKSVHDPSDKLKRKALEMYGETPGASRIDNLIPLELGGSNDIRNLWPARAEPRPGLNEKNAAEKYLRRQVCQGHMALEDAQRLIATDWMAVYRSIP